VPPQALGSLVQGTGGRAGVKRGGVGEGGVYGLGYLGGRRIGYGPQAADHVTVSEELYSAAR